MPDRRQLLVLPGALVVGHLAASLTTGHPTVGRPAAWGSALVQILVCVGLPLALWATATAALDAMRGRRTDSSPGALVAQQVVGFVLLDLVEHAATGTSPWGALRGSTFWIALSVHIAVALVAWAGLRLAGLVGTTLARLVRTTSIRLVGAPSLSRMRVPPARVIDIYALSRRGPPVLEHSTTLRLIA